MDPNELNRLKEKERKLLRWELLSVYSGVKFILIIFLISICGILIYHIFKVA